MNRYDRHTGLIGLAVVVFVLLAIWLTEPEPKPVPQPCNCADICRKAEFKCPLEDCPGARVEAIPHE